MRQHQTMVGQRIMLIVAHPDDEAFLASGTMDLNHRIGGTTGLICATLGEKGSSHLSKPVSPTQLKAIRKRELQAAAKMTHIRPLHILYLPDGRLSAVADQFHRKALPLVKKFKPTIIVTFGPDGITGHRDHITAGKVGRKIAKQLGLRLCVFTIVPHLAKTAPKVFMQRRKNPHYLPIAPYQAAAHRIKIHTQRKHRVLLNYASQIDGRHPFSGWPKGASKIFMHQECFGELKP